jgi:hypothetical protein
MMMSPSWRRTIRAFGRRIPSCELLALLHLFERVSDLPFSSQARSHPHDCASSVVKGRSELGFGERIGRVHIGVY